MQPAPPLALGVHRAGAAWSSNMAAPPTWPSRRTPRRAPLAVCARPREASWCRLRNRPHPIRLFRRRADERGRVKVYSLTRQTGALTACVCARVSPNFFSPKGSESCATFDKQAICFFGLGNCIQQLLGPNVSDEFSAWKKPSEKSVVGRSAKENVKNGSARCTSRTVAPDVRPTVCGLCGLVQVLLRDDNDLVFSTHAACHGRMD